MLGRDELRRVLPLASAYALILASLYVLKPARNALFLDKIGLQQLPFVLILVALVGGAAAAVYGRYASRIRTDRLILRTYLAMMLMLAGFRLLIPLATGWIFYAFYVWVALYGLLTTSLIWLLANAVFTPREARRVFGFIGTGGIAGAIAGGAATGQIAGIVGTENLLIVCIFLIGLSLLLLSLVPSIEPSSQKRTRNEAPVGLEAIFESKLLSSIAITAALIAIIAVVVDIQFNAIVDHAYPDRDAKTAFFGSFFAYLSAFGFLFQLLVTPWILRSLGVGVAILILPVTMGLGSAAIIIYPGLIAGMLAKGADGGFRHSIYRSGSEVLFLPVPPDVKKVTKLFLDTTVDTSATGIGALAVLLVTGTFGVEYRMLSIITVGLTVVTFFFARRMRRAYVDAFRKALEGQKIDPSDLRIDLTEAGAISALLPLLESDNERRVLYVLDILSSARSRLVVDRLASLLEHHSPEVRRRALIALANQNGESLRTQCERLLADPDDGVRTEAMFLTCRIDGDTGRIERHLLGDDPKLRAAALGCIARHDAAEVKRLITPELGERLIAVEDESMRALAARALASAGSPGLRPLVEELTRDPSPRVVIALIEGLGAARDRTFVPWLMDAMSRRQLRRPARQALAKLGHVVLGTLGSALADPHLDLPMQRAIPRVLGDIGEQRSVDLLLRHLEDADPIVRANVARALSKLRVAHPRLTIDRPTIARAVVDEARKLYHLAQIIAVVGAPDEGGADRPSWKLLRRALTEKKERVLERIFVLLGLRYRPHDMENAYHGYVRGQPQMRSSAIELLDNLVRKDLRDQVLPLLEQSDGPGMIEVGRATFGEPIETRVAALAHLIAGDDAWLRACALYELPEAPAEALRDLAEQAKQDPDPIVRETATLIATRAWTTP